MFLFCRDDDEVQLRDVRQDEGRKNKPLSNLGKRVVQVVEKGTPVTPIVSVPEATKVASPTTSMEEITPHPKR